MECRKKQQSRSPAFQYLQHLIPTPTMQARRGQSPSSQRDDPRLSAGGRRSELRRAATRASCKVASAYSSAMRTGVADAHLKAKDIEHVNTGRLMLETMRESTTSGSNNLSGEHLLSALTRAASCPLIATRVPAAQIGWSTAIRSLSSASSLSPTWAAPWSLRAPSTCVARAASASSQGQALGLYRCSGSQCTSSRPSGLATSPHGRRVRARSSSCSSRASAPC